METHISDVRTIGIPVSDQSKALDFYVGKLGFEKRLDVPTPNGGRWIEVAPSGATTSLALVTGLPTGVETGIHFITDDAPADHQTLAAAGVAVGELLRWPGVPPMFAFRDPDGNGLELVGAA